MTRCLPICISRTGYWQWENHSRPSGMTKRPNGGLAISISGCSDDQKSADASVCPALNQNSSAVCRNSCDEMQVQMLP
jgi:hypothetical protein